MVSNKKQRFKYICTLFLSMEEEDFEEELDELEEDE
jgi:hypothetical protein